MGPVIPDPPSPDPTHRLPRPLSGFVGREREIAALSALLTSPAVRLLTITGPGGIGKTRLAIETASALSGAFPDGIALAPLAPVNDPDLVPGALAHALGLEPRPDITARDALHEALADKGLLLVIDNLEHLLSAGPLLTDLLQAHSRLTILTTSRTRLDLSGEQVFMLEPLDQDDARRLFQHRAGIVNVARIPSDDLTTIDAICARLDGIPLAIELAAARTATLPPAALLNRLARPLTILRHGPRDGPLRHQTMRDTIAWSYDLLDDDRRAGFRQLAVFVGGFTLDGAQATLGDECDALDLVDFLVARSLVTPMPGESCTPRFTMLESIRQFGVDELVASGDEDTTRQAHADYLIALAEEAIPHYDAPAIHPSVSAIRDEMANVRSALAWALDRKDGIRANRLAGGIWRLWQNGESRWLLTGTWSERIEEGQELTGRALELRDGVPSHYLIEPIIGYVDLLKTLGEHDTIFPWCEELLERALEIGDRSGELWARRNLACRGSWAEGREHLAKALVAARESRDPENQTATVYRALGELELSVGDLASAESHLRQALALASGSGNPYTLSFITIILAHVCHRQGQARDAGRFALQGLGHLAALHDVVRMQLPTAIIAEIALSLHESTAATRLLAYAVTVPRRSSFIDLNEERIAPFRAALPEPAFSQEWEAGTRLSPEDIRVMAERIVEILDREPSPPPTLIPTSLLSPREEEVLHLLVAGRTNRAIGQELFISERTVEKHVLHIMTKLDLDSRTGIVAWAVRNGVVA